MITLFRWPILGQKDIFNKSMDKKYPDASHHKNEMAMNFAAGIVAFTNLLNDPN